MGFSARGVAAMTEANGRPRVPGPLRKELVISDRRGGTSSRQQEEDVAGSVAHPHGWRAGDLVRGKAREAPGVLDRIGLQQVCFLVGSISSRRSGERLATLSVSLEVLTLTPQWS